MYGYPKREDPPSRAIPASTPPSRMGAPPNSESRSVEAAVKQPLVQSIYAAMEDRPTVASPYDDEFDASTLDGKWTQTTGSASDYVLSRSRLLAVNSIVLEQAITLGDPMRLMLGIRGNGTVTAYSGVGLVIVGGTKCLRLVTDTTSTGTARRFGTQRLSAARAWEADLSMESTAGSILQSDREQADQVLTITIDATNLYSSFGGLGSGRIFSTVARAVVGTLNSIYVDVSAGWSLRWFRVDRATTHYAFPLDWAG